MVIKKTSLTFNLSCKIEDLNELAFMEIYLRSKSREETFLSNCAHDFDLQERQATLLQFHNIQFTFKSLAEKRLNHRCKRATRGQCARFAEAARPQHAPIPIHLTKTLAQVL